MSAKTTQGTHVTKIMSNERFCPIMSRMSDDEKGLAKVRCAKDCAWYMDVSAKGDEKAAVGVCALAFGMLCQQGVMGGHIILE